MIKLNCPNCGAPIDIHRKDCEYCGTPYDLKDREVLYADNQPFYIYQDPIEWNDNALDRISNQLRNIESRLQTRNLEAWTRELTQQCVNSAPRVYYEPYPDDTKDNFIKRIFKRGKHVRYS